MSKNKGNRLDKTRANKKMRNSMSTVVVFGLILLISLNVYGAVLEFVEKIKNESHFAGFEVDKNAVVGGQAEIDREKIQEDLNKKVSETMINISMNTFPVFKDGKSAGNLNIINEGINNYMQVVEIYLKDTNELIYKSGGIPVGSKIEMASLNKALGKGEYDCTAYFNAVNSETGEFIGKAGATITISILN